MVIKYHKNFNKHILEIVEFIKKDSEERALNFYDELQEKISSVKFMPYKHRKNLELDKDNVRDLIFKGYVIPFLVDKNEIIILDIYKHNIWKWKK